MKIRKDTLFLKPNLFENTNCLKKARQDFKWYVKSRIIFVSIFKNGLLKLKYYWLSPGACVFFRHLDIFNMAAKTRYFKILVITLEGER